MTVREAKQPSMRIVILTAIALVSALGIAMAIFMLRGAKVESIEDDSCGTKQIASVPAAVITNTPKATPVVKKPVDPNARPTRVGEIVNGYIKLPSGRIHKRVGVITNAVTSNVKLPCEIFGRKCNNEIACYLTIPFGTEIVDMPNYNGRFKQDFIDSIKEPIIIGKDDSPEDVELKKAVIAARQDLKDALDRGEDIEKIMFETRNELRQMGLYKQELNNQFNEYRKQENVSDEDIEEFLTACNTLLDQKGIAPIKFGPLVRRNLKMKKEQ